MSYARSRARTLTEPLVGNLYSSLTHSWTHPSVTRQEVQTCEDVVGNYGGDNAFSCERHGSEHVSITGATSAYIWEHVPTQAGAYAGPGHLLSAGISDSELNSLGVQVVAKTNINTPSVSLPVWYATAHELPAMVRSYGFEALKKISRYPGLPRGLRIERFDAGAAQAYLQARWGWAPMVSDVKKMWDFTRSVERRMAQIRALASGEVVKRNVVLDRKEDWALASNLLIYSTGVTVNTGGRVVKTTQKTWGSCHWSVDESLARFGLEFPRTADAQLDAAISAEWGLHGQQLSLAAWELIPWSWLIDWFTCFGELLKANQSSIPVTHSRVNVMRLTETYETSNGLTASKPVTFSGAWRRYRVTKVRRPAPNPSPLTISFEALLEPNKWSILGSLAVLRRLPTRSAI